jgi:uncharacterized membrane protein
MPVFEVVLMLAAFMCSLVAGFLFAFAVVVMPGINNLDDGAFIRAFQTIDRIIQNNQPLFMFVWAGSVLAVIGMAVMAIWALTGADRLLIIVAALLYLLGVQVPTIAINIPLNSQLQKLDVATMTGTARQRARETFEARWNRWNVIRTLCACVVSGLLMLLLRRA